MGSNNPQERQVRTEVKVTEAKSPEFKCILGSCFFAHLLDV